MQIMMITPFYRLILPCHLTSSFIQAIFIIEITFLCASNRSFYDGSLIGLTAVSSLRFVYCFPIAYSCKVKMEEKTRSRQ